MIYRYVVIWQTSAMSAPVAWIYSSQEGAIRAAFSFRQGVKVHIRRERF